jgi:predicted ferric reductase
LLLVGLHAVEGLQHGLHQLCLGGEQLLQVSVVVVVLIVVVGVAVAGLAIALAIPGVHHLMVWKKGRLRFHITQLYAQGIWGKCCHFIFLNIDEVVDKVPKHPTTLTNTHKQKHQSSNKR